MVDILVIVYESIGKVVRKGENGGYQVISMPFVITQHPSASGRLSDVRPSVDNLLVNTLASTNINQSSPNVVKMYMTTRAWISFIMELIGPELSELSALELENLPYLTMFCP